MQSSIYITRLTVEWRHRPGHRVPAVKTGWCRTSALSCCIWPKAEQCCWDKRLETCIWASTADILGSCARRQIRRLRHTECPRTGHFQTPRIFGVPSISGVPSQLQDTEFIKYAGQSRFEILPSTRSRTLDDASVGQQAKAIASFAFMGMLCSWAGWFTLSTCGIVRLSVPILQ